MLNTSLFFLLLVLLFPSLLFDIFGEGLFSLSTHLDFLVDPRFAYSPHRLDRLLGLDCYRLGFCRLDLLGRIGRARHRLLEVLTAQVERRAYRLRLGDVNGSIFGKRMILCVFDNRQSLLAFCRFRVCCAERLSCKNAPSVKCICYTLNIILLKLQHANLITECPEIVFFLGVLLSVKQSPKETKESFTGFANLLHCLIRRNDSRQLILKLCLINTVHFNRRKPGIETSCDFFHILYFHRAGSDILFPHSWQGLIEFRSNASPSLVCNSVKR